MHNTVTQENEGFSEMRAQDCCRSEVSPIVWTHWQTQNMRYAISQHDLGLFNCILLYDAEHTQFVSLHIIAQQTSQLKIRSWDSRIKTYVPLCLSAIYHIHYTVWIATFLSKVWSMVSRSRAATRLRSVNQSLSRVHTYDTRPACHTPNLREP